MKSKIFYGDAYEKIEGQIRELVNNQGTFLSGSTARSPRAAGDAIQEIIEGEFGTILGTLSSEYSANFARRAMADLAFRDVDGLYYIVDVKTHRMDTKFNMPNLTSVERLSRFYEDDQNYFVVLMVDYNVSEDYNVNCQRVHFVPIEHLSWNCLTLGALGWGQIQIANASEIEFVRGYSRRKWMLELCANLREFYPKEIEKIHRRMKRFADIEKRWQSKDDLWE